MSATLVHGQGTRVGFYATTCPRAESIVSSTVATQFRANPAIAPALLRMHFHDCFVRVIDDAKTQLEAACPGIVSCADILALAARDSVVLLAYSIFVHTGGRSWLVPTGRRDGRVSLSSETTDLPGFRESIDSQKQKFSAKGLNTQDLVVLVGGHTIGTTACQFFSYRLYNFNGTASSDPAINASFLPQLQALCPQNGDGTKRVAFDTGSENRFDASFFDNLRDGRGILESDQKLWTDASTRAIVQRFLGITGLAAFNVEFGRSMVKMSNTGVKTGTDGEIRKICSAINS
ncbi:hypothetical protein GH714_030574 [Hevea brasiliensis]|uniref:Peroxidase n=1 Tax=Hevea brasiliensis TaxID=3981 RepID=A0A6A6L3L7_HEVBR|nr:hypothetical protein GH714_030574 [Hevea brasiliensis]